VADIGAGTMVGAVAIAVTLAIFILGCAWRLSARLTTQDNTLLWLSHQLSELVKRVEKL
jgi:hypothetical protein